MLQDTKRHDGDGGIFPRRNLAPDARTTNSSIGADIRGGNWQSCAYSGLRVHLTACCRTCTLPAPAPAPLSTTSSPTPPTFAPAAARLPSPAPTATPAPSMPPRYQFLIALSGNWDSREQCACLAAPEARQVPCEGKAQEETHRMGFIARMSPGARTSHLASQEPINEPLLEHDLPPQPQHLQTMYTTTSDLPTHATVKEVDGSDCFRDLGEL